MKLYLHTIDGRPAGFSKNDKQIVYANKNTTTKWKAKPVKDLRQIKEEQKKTFEFRKKNNYSYEESEYNYVIIEVGEWNKMNGSTNRAILKLNSNELHFVRHNKDYEVNQK